MLTFAQLIRKVTASGATEIRLVSDKPILVARGSSHRELGEPLNASQILTMVTKSLPNEVTEGFRWGKEVQHRLDFDGVPWVVRVILKSKEDVRVQLRDASDESTVSGTAQSRGSLSDSVEAVNPGPTASLSEYTPTPTASHEVVSPPREFTAEQTATVRALSEGEQVALVYGEFGKSPKMVSKALETSSG